MLRTCILASEKILRDSAGRFQKGHSGNTGGRPKDEHKVAELARSFTTEAIDTLVALMRTGKDERVCGTDAQALLDMGWGKAKVEVATSGGETYIEALQAAAEVIKAEKY